LGIEIGSNPNWRIWGFYFDERKKGRERMLVSVVKGECVFFSFVFSFLILENEFTPNNIFWKKCETSIFWWKKS
jgi:hypothetical protein